MAIIDTIERGRIIPLKYDIKTDGVMFMELAQLEAIRDAAIVTANGEILRLTTYGKEWLRWGTTRCGHGYEVYPLPQSRCVDDMETVVFYIELHEDALDMEIARLQAIADTVEKLKQEAAQ